MRFRRLTPQARSRFLASGLFLIALSTTASLLAPDRSAGMTPKLSTELSSELSSELSPDLSPRPSASLVVEVERTTRRTGDCPSAG